MNKLHKNSILQRVKNSVSYMIKKCIFLKKAGTITAKGHTNSAFRHK